MTINPLYLATYLWRRHRGTIATVVTVLAIASALAAASDVDGTVAAAVVELDARLAAAIVVGLAAVVAVAADRTGDV